MGGAPLKGLRMFKPAFMLRRTTFEWNMAALAFFAICSHSIAAAPDGKIIYHKMCSDCHGSKGEGVKDVADAFSGSHSLAQLTDVIARTMPEDKPGSLSAAQANAVANFIHTNIYPKLPKTNNQQARIELARLTVRQYRNTVADLIGSYRWNPWWAPERGLKGEYFSHPHMNGGHKQLERNDPVVKFDFKADSPVPGKIQPHVFSIRWTGAFLAPETGEYQFIVRSNQSVKLDVNALWKKPLVDGWVRSGDKTEFTGSIYLVGGRIYPIKLELSKGKQGVDDSKNQKGPPPPVPAFVELLWKVPNRPVEVIPARALMPKGAPEMYIVSTPFPPDDRSYGWERGTTISKAWDQATTDAAIAAAEYIVPRLEEFAKCKDNDPERQKKVREFCRSFVERAFRRPLTPELTKSYIDDQFAAAKSPEAAVQRVVLLTLMSPRFLYREVDVPPAYAVASRLSYGIWDSMPDQQLFQAAEKGWLSTPDALMKQAERMLQESRAKAKIRGFLMTWLKANEYPDMAKDVKRFPGFSDAIVADLRTSLELFLDDVVWSDRSDFRDLLLSKDVFLNDRLAKFYGVNAPAGGEFARAPLNADKRSGIISHPYLLASFAHDAETSPIHRGVFVARGLLGVSLKPPPDAVTPVSATLHPTLNTRERVSLQTKSAACMTCHTIINDLGFTLEQFDAVGRIRDKDNNKAIDSSGGYRTRDGQFVKVNGAAELANFVVGSEEAHSTLR